MGIFLKKIRKKIKAFRYDGRIILAEWGISSYGKRILPIQKGNDLLSAAIASGKPFLAGRFGNVELSCLTFYLLTRKKTKAPYPEIIKETMGNNAGFFPVNDENLDKYCEILQASVEQINLMGVWFNENEDFVCRNICPAAALSALMCLEPYYHHNPWSAKLAGKKVLVISPFVKTIANQYQNNRQNIFADQSVLPEFDLLTVRAVQSAAGEKTEFADWFAALESMKKEIAEKDFAVALIGAGAYGLPLSAYVKSLGKQAVYLGGATQILFGIKGKRWDNFPSVSRFYNEHWVRPLPEETPSGAARVEDGCYW